MEKERFEPVGRATAREATGPGLAIVHKAVGGMGGRSGAESEAGRGGRFRMQLKGANP
jgi:signal transduction histidine kinase